MMIETQINPELEQIKEVYANFGLAMYQAHCLERQLAIILAAEYRPGPIGTTDTENGNVLEKLFSMTMGELVRKINEIGALSEDERKRLNIALKTRNRLAHRYFWDRYVEFTSASGRDSMIDELRDAADQFSILFGLFSNKEVEWEESLGVTQHLWDQHVERLIRDCREA